MKQIVRYLKPYLGKLLAATVLIALSTLCDLLLPTWMSAILNGGIAARDFPAIAVRCLQMLAIAAVSLASILGGTRLSTEVVACFCADLRADVFRKVNTLSFEEFGSLGTAALVTRATQGRILFDGRDAAGLSKHTLRRGISSVLQGAAIYSGTIGENIRMGDPDADDAAVTEAARIAQLSDFIASCEGGLSYEIRQAGKNLSGGQKQRLAIARAIIKDAPIYIFDDSFSALDFLTEKNLRTALNRRIAGRTQIVVTQRITSAMSADCIFVMDGGCLVDSGTHDELLARCRIYREIYASQTGGDLQ